ncbi:hypothetical protein [Streptomyces wuyuanensis]|uniref:hypothetical protein n=1 Tax=Streptomyces wuyuanensis TaxID=1196353 RepID=UPI0036A4DFEC
MDLADEQFDRLTEVSAAVPLGMPHDASAGVLDAVRGGAASLLTEPAIPVA